MKIFEAILSNRKLVILAALVLALSGVLAAISMPRQEDSRIEEYWGLVVTPFPGADAEKVERLVVDPIEEYLAEVSEVKLVKTIIRSGVAIMIVELHNGVNVIEAWDEVRRSLAKAKKEFPASAGEPELDDKLQDPESVVLAITGSADPLVLGDAADALKKEFLAIPTVSRVKLIADPEEQVTIEFSDSLARRLGIDPRFLAQQLSARNLTVPGGSLKVGGKKVILRFNDEYESIEDIRTTPILLPSGAAIPLGELAGVRRSPQEPAVERMRFMSRPATGLAIVPRKGIDLVKFGQLVRAKLTEVRKLFPHVEIHEVTFQPDRVKSRLINLGQSLLLSVTIVAGVLVLAMGLRLGFIVASIVPLVALSSLAIYQWGGGILQQISIAAFVIALGMLVDNAIVMAENVQMRIDSGVDPNQAAQDAVKELSIPLAAATGTTLAAFLPMLLAQSTTADFTRALPSVIIITLSVSYLFAISVTPIMSAALLKPRSEMKSSPLRRVSDALSGLALRRSKIIISAAFILVIGSLAASNWIDKRFFPASDRNQLIIELKLPEGAHLSEIDTATAKVESELSKLKEVVSYASFMGRGAPQFYYNVPRLPNVPHLAHIVVTTTSLDSVARVLVWARGYVRKYLPEVEVVARRLEQGPPLDAPVEVRVVGRQLNVVQKSANKVLTEVRKISQAVDVRTDMGLGVPTIQYRIDDASAARHGLSRSDVAMAVQGRIRGLEVGQYRAGEDPVSILVRSEAGEELPVRDLSATDIAPPGGKPVPLAQVATSKVEWLPAVIHHRNRKRLVTVSSQLAEGATYSQVLEKAKPELASLKLPSEINIEYGGGAEESDEANAAMFAMLPIGMMVLVLILMAEFNSIRRVSIILVTVPLAAAGVVPGLLIGGQPFGFQSLLGVFALAGVVVNNAIVLVDNIELHRRRGSTLESAIAKAVKVRTRPILLTTATTVLGLMPLAFSSSNLWPPLAWAMISGLLASTGLTLLVVPSLYKVLFNPRATQHVEEPATS